jgi:hypothetical protein
MARIINKVHISTIQPGDVIFHNGADRTLSQKDIKHCPFMGTTVFGDSYHLGYKQVNKVTFKTN